MTVREKLKTLSSLYLVCAKIGGMTFGGGLAMMPMMQRELVEKRKWITDDDLLDYYAVGQSTPGIIAVNVSTFVGYRQMGVVGGIVATLGMVSPSLVIIMLLAGLMNSISDFPLVQKALSGVNVAVAVLLTRLSVDFCRKTVKNVFSALVAGASFVLVRFFKVQSFFVILGAVLLGLAIYFANNVNFGKSKAEAARSSKGQKIKSTHTAEKSVRGSSSVHPGGNAKTASSQKSTDTGLSSDSENPGACENSADVHDKSFRVYDESVDAHYKSSRVYDESVGAYDESSAGEVRSAPEKNGKGGKDA